MNIQYTLYSFEQVDYNDFRNVVINYELLLNGL